MGAALLLLALAARAATLEGTVTNVATGAPLKKARISARGRERSYFALSDTSGRWSISPLTAGEYELSVQCQGFLAPTTRRAVRVPDDGAVSFALTPLSVISGRALDEEGEPLADVSVSALSYDYSRPAPLLRVVGKASTDDRGEFRLFDLKPGRYYVQAAAADRSRAVLFHPGVLDASQASPVDIAPGGESGGIEFRMRRTALYRVKGKLVDARTGEPFRAVVVAEAPGAAGPRYTAPAQPNGVFELAAVQPGNYWLNVTQNSGPQEMFAQQTVSVRDRDIEGVELAAAPVAEIPGAISIDGPARTLNVRVTLNPVERPGFSANALPKPDGSFTITAGAQLFALELTGIPPDLYLREIRLGAEDASSGLIDLRRGSAPLTLALAQNPGRVDGIVCTREGKPAGGVLVAITPADPAMRRHDLTRTVYTDEDGSFAAGSLAPGEYRVFAWERYDTSLAAAAAFRHALAERAMSVTIRPGAQEGIRLEPLSETDAQNARSRIP